RVRRGLDGKADLQERQGPHRRRVQGRDSALRLAVGQRQGHLQGRSQGQAEGRQGQRLCRLQGHRQGRNGCADRARGRRVCRGEGKVRRLCGQRQGRLRQGSEGDLHQGESRRESERQGERC